MAIEPAPNAGFIEQPDRDKKIAYIPFQRAWIKPGFDKSHYKEYSYRPRKYPVHAENGLAS